MDLVLYNKRLDLIDFRRLRKVKGKVNVRPT